MRSPAAVAHLLLSRVGKWEPLAVAREVPELLRRILGPEMAVVHIVAGKHCWQEKLSDSFFRISDRRKTTILSDSFRIVPYRTFAKFSKMQKIMELFLDSYSWNC